jgi:DNA-binding protein H-NS
VAKIDQYRKMKMEDLIEMQADIAIVIQEKKEEATNTFKKEMEDRAKSLGIDISSLFGGKRRGPNAGGKVAPKYRNPKDNSQTWTGRGRQPTWMTEALKERGTKKEDFLI